MASSTAVQLHALQTETGRASTADNSTETTDSDEFIEFDMYPDVYVFSCLLYEKGHWSKMSASDKFVVLTFLIISFIVQFSSMGVMIYVTAGYEDDFSNGENVREISAPVISGQLSCTEDAFGSNYTLNYTQCNFAEHNLIYAGEVTTKDFIARAVSMGLVLCFVYSNIASLVHYSLIIQNTYSKNSACCVYACIPWIVMLGLQKFVIVVLFVSISRLILFQTSLLDALSIGVGFVILMEVDDHMYEFAKKITFLKRIDLSEFFSVKIERENRNTIIRNGIFQYIKVQTFNCIIFWVFCIAAVWGIISLMIRYRYYVELNQYMIWKSLFDGFGYMFLLAPALLILWIPLKNCCKCK